MFDLNQLEVKRESSGELSIVYKGHVVLVITESGLWRCVYTHPDIPQDERGRIYLNEDSIALKEEKETTTMLEMFKDYEKTTKKLCFGFLHRDGANFEQLMAFAQLIQSTDPNKELQFNEALFNWLVDTHKDWLRWLVTHGYLKQKEQPRRFVNSDAVKHSNDIVLRMEQNRNGVVIYCGAFKILSIYPGKPIYIWNCIFDMEKLGFLRDATGNIAHTEHFCPSKKK